ncbi:MAG: hypothetical protein V4683_01625 [Bacteroidota bacterium]
MNRIIIILMLFGIISCRKTGTKALEKGNYYQAVMQAAEKLKSDPKNEKALQVLPNAYNSAVEELLSDISRNQNANLQFRWENVLDYYNQLNRMQETIERCTACRRIVSPKTFYKETESVRESAVNERISLADRLLNTAKSTNNKLDARSAYNHYEKVLNFAPNTIDIRNKLNEALFFGSYHVVLEQARINSRMYQYSNEYFLSKVDEFAKNNRRLNKFIRFYTPEEAKTENLKPDHIVRLEFVDFIVGETLIQTDRQTLTSKDSVKTGDATIGGKKVAVYGKVNATLIKNKKTVRSAGVLLMEMIDYQSNRLIKKEELGGEFIWINDWANFNGDERALSTADKLAIKMKEELPPPPQTLFIEFTKPIYDQLTVKIKQFYDKY